MPCQMFLPRRTSSKRLILWREPRRVRIFRDLISLGSPANRGFSQHVFPACILVHSLTRHYFALKRAPQRFDRTTGVQKQRPPFVLERITVARRMTENQCPLRPSTAPLRMDRTAASIVGPLESVSNGGF